MVRRLIDIAQSVYQRLQEMALFLPMLVLVGGIWIFVEIADEVLEGDTNDFDRWAVRAFRRANDLTTPIGPGWLHEAGRDLTALGGVIVLVLMTFIVAGYMRLHRKFHAMWLTLSASFSGLLLAALLKRYFSRDRPDEVPHLSIVATSSFPSGHSMLSAVVYLTLGLLLTRIATGRATKIYPLVVAMVLTFLVGVSRVYLGVHYPTDVLAGWTAGGVWALFCWSVMRYLQKRGQVEPPSTPANP